MGKIVKNGVTYSGSSDNADNVKYNNNVSNLDATNVQEAITEVNGKLGKYKLSTSGFFTVDLVVGTNRISANKLLAGSLPQTQNTLFTVVSQGTSTDRLIDIFFDGNDVVAYTNVAQRYSVTWVSFEMA